MADFNPTYRDELTPDEQLIARYRAMKPVEQELFVKQADPETILVIALYEMTWDHVSTGKYFIRIALKKMRSGQSGVPVVGEVK